MNIKMKTLMKICSNDEALCEQRFRLSVGFLYWCLNNAQFSIGYSISLVRFYFNLVWKIVYVQKTMPQVVNQKIYSVMLPKTVQPLVTIGFFIQFYT